LNVDGFERIRRMRVAKDAALADAVAQGRDVRFWFSA
jgi:hypothetical protein